MSSQLRKTGSTSAWRRLRSLVLAEEPLCHWCQSRTSEHVDHIVSRAHGGNDARENLVGACGPCNLARGAGRIRVNREPW